MIVISLPVKEIYFVFLLSIVTTEKCVDNIDPMSLDFADGSISSSSSSGS